MNFILENKLFSKYPRIFKQKDFPVTQTCMCWGIECAEGWYKIIDILCNLLQFDIDNNEEPQIEATQVKEKYGTLRFYTNYSTDKQEGYIRFAEYLSSITCEQCGSMNKVSQTKGWIITLCNKCMFKYKIRQIIRKYFGSKLFHIEYKIKRGFKNVFKRKKETK